MKIYNISEIPEGLRVPSYEVVLLSGSTDGYEDGYSNYVCYRKMYLTIEALENGRISIGNTVMYSINDGPWQSAVCGGTISVEEGDVVRFKGMNTGQNTFVNTALKCITYGNIMSLVYGDGFIGKTELPGESTFNSCYGNCVNMTDASNLILPATELTGGCYRQMFSSCMSLTGVPKLPATSLAQGCYWRMFAGCSSLVNAPELPATVMAFDCYDSMFAYTGIETAPVLPATELDGLCYSFMFRGCVNLINAPELPATTLSLDCYMGMFKDCTSLVNAPELPATNIHHGCYDSMFAGCTSLVNAPTLPATNLDNVPGSQLQDVYRYMFSGCTSLVTAPVLPAINLFNGCYHYMFAVCTSLVNAPVLPAEHIKPYSYAEMFKGCSLLDKVECYATTWVIHEDPGFERFDSTYEWLDGTSANGTFYKATNTQNEWSRDSSGIPDGWTVIEV